MRLAHFSDIHVNLPPPLGELRHFKCVLGLINHYGLGRGRHFARVETRIATLLEDVEAQAPDHVLCTGDLTMMGLEAEIAGAAAIFGARLQRPERWTVLPGNHDRYTQDGVRARRFERSFDAVCTAGREFPHLKRLGPGVVAVLVDACVPRRFASSGRCGAAQLGRLLEVLTDPSLANEYVILAIHYGLLRPNGQRDRWNHRLEDDRDLLALIDRAEVHLDLVLHGHIHRSYSVRSARRLLICAGSATDLARQPGYNVYDIDPDRRTLAIERRLWDPGTQRYRSPSDGLGPRS